MGRADHPVARAFLRDLDDALPFAVALGQLAVRARFAPDFGLVLSVERMPPGSFSRPWLEGDLAYPQLTWEGALVWDKVREVGCRRLARLPSFDAGEALLVAVILSPAAHDHARAELPAKREAA